MNEKGLFWILKRLDTMRPFNGEDLKSNKGYSLKMLILLFAILEHEGETQTFYSQLLGWTKQNTSVHAKTLIEDGYILRDDDERDYRCQAKRVYLVKGVREYMESLINNTEV